MKKKIAIALGVLALLAGAMIYNLERAVQEPVTKTPGPVDEGRAKLHAQLVDAKQQESQLEKQAWNSIAQLHQLIDWHQQRIDKLTGNSQAGEILAYDQDAIARLQKRITDLEAQYAAQQQAAALKAAEDAQAEQQQ